MRRLMLFIFVFLFVFTSHAQETDIPPRPIITPENAHNLTQIAQLGRGNILDIAFSEDENTLLVASTIGIWEYDMADLSAEPSLFAQRKLPNGSFSPNGELFISVVDNVLTVWHIAQNRVIAQADVTFENQLLYEISHDSRQIAILLDDDIHLLDIASNQMTIIVTLSDRFQDSLNMRWNPDGTKIAIHNRIPDEEQDWKTHEEFWMWDIATGEVVTYIAFPDFSNMLPQIDDIQFSSDGETLVIGDSIGRMRLWSVMGGVELHVVSKYETDTNHVLFSPDGHSIVSAGGRSVNGYNGQVYTAIHLWDVELEESLVLMKGHLGRVIKMFFTPDGHRLVSLDDYEVIRVWNVHIGEQIGVISDHNNQGLLYGNSDDTLFVSGSSDNSLYVWDADTFTPQLIPNLSESPSPIHPIGFSPDGRTFIAYSWFGERFLAIDTTTWQVRHIGYASALRSTDFHPTMPVLIFTNKWYNATFWNYETGEFVFDAITDINLYRFEFLPESHQIIYNDTHFASPNRSNLLIVINTDTGETIDILEHPSDATWMALSPDRQTLISNPYGNTLWIWDTSAWTIRLILEGSYRAFTQDSRQIILHIDNRLVFVDSETGISQHEIALPSDIAPTRNIRLSPEHDWFAYISEDADFVLVDIQTGTERISFSVADLITNYGYGDVLPDFDISPDARLIFIIGETTQVWAIDTGDMP